MAAMADPADVDEWLADLARIREQLEDVGSTRDLPMEPTLELLDSLMERLRGWRERDD